MIEAAREAEECIDAGGGNYFRRFQLDRSPSINIGERVWYVEDGYLRGYAVVSRAANIPRRMQCDTTGRWYEPGFYVFMPADSWRWIRPQPMVGFQGYRYFCAGLAKHYGINLPIKVIGGWLDPKPETA